VTCFEKHISEVVFTQQGIWNFLGNRLFEAHIHGNAQATETELLEVGISFADLPVQEYKDSTFTTAFG
jgi:hypothetical protein